MSKKENTTVWEKYQKGVSHHHAINLYKETQKCHNFFIGNQWNGLKAGGEDFPIFNFIKPVGKYKVSMIAQNSMAIVYSSMTGKDPIASTVCDLLTKFAANQWEKAKLDSIMWQMIKRAFIAGDSYLYCFDDKKPSNSVKKDLKPQLKHRIVNNTAIHFSDEENPSINEQEYIIIEERIPVSRIKKIAKSYGIKQDEIDLIVADDDTSTNISTSRPTSNHDDSKCTCILYMQKTPEGISFCRSTRKVVYQPMSVIKGLDAYPIAALRWEETVGSARGVSGVKYMIPNQLEVNKTAARRAMAVKRFAFPTLAYDADRVANASALNEVGASIAIKNLDRNPISNLISFLNPMPISNDAQNFQNELIVTTRQLEGAGDAATGQVDPTKASGAAIKAARDQSAVPLNEQISAYKQLVEDLAIIWYNLWVAYSSNGLQLDFKDDSQPISKVVSQDTLKKLDVAIKIDVSPVDPFSKVSQELSIDRLFQSPLIKDTALLKEYVQTLDDSSTVPKSKLTRIVEEREKAELMAKIEKLKMAKKNVQAKLDESASGSGFPPDFPMELMGRTSPEQPSPEQTGLEQAGLEQAGLEQLIQGMSGMSGMSGMPPQYAQMGQTMPPMPQI